MTSFFSPRATGWDTWLQLLVFLLGLSIFLSNTGIYLCSALLVLYCVARLIADPDYRNFFQGNKVVNLSLLLYALGLAVTIIHPGAIEDISFYARKAGGLLILPPLLEAFRHKAQRNTALAALILGFWASLFYTMHQIGWWWTGGRVAGTWLVDVWGVVLAMFVAFIVPHLFTPGTKREGHSLSLKMLYAITTVAATILLVMSGGRGPWLGTLLAIFLFLLLYRRRLLLYLVLLLPMLYLPIHFWNPTPVTQTMERAESITDLEDRGNWIRLTLWKLSACHSLHTAINEPWKFLLGHGPKSHEAPMMAFHRETDCLSPETKERLRPFPTNDMHNMYLDTLAKMGAVWTTLFLLFIVSFLFRRTPGSPPPRPPRLHTYIEIDRALPQEGRAAEGHQASKGGEGEKTALQEEPRNHTEPFHQGAMGVVVVFLVTGVFYSIALHWANFMLAYFIALGYAPGPGGREVIVQRNTIQEGRE